MKKAIITAISLLFLSQMGFSQTHEANKDAAITQIDNAIDSDGELGDKGLRGGDISFYNFKTGQDELVKDVFSMTDEKAHEFIPRNENEEIDPDLMAFYNSYRTDNHSPYESLFATWVELFKLIKPSESQ